MHYGVHMLGKLASCWQASVFVLTSLCGRRTAVNGVTPTLIKKGVITVKRLKKGASVYIRLN
jgi:hypothetical protein